MSVLFNLKIFGFFILSLSGALTSELYDSHTNRTSSYVYITSHRAILRDIEKTLQTTSPSSILIIYDIDQCVIYPDQPGIPMHESYLYQQHVNLITQDLTPLQKIIHADLTKRFTPSKVSDEDLPGILSYLYRSKIHTLGLTSLMAGGVLAPSDEQHSEIYDKLARLKLHFKLHLRAFPHLHNQNQHYPYQLDSDSFPLTSLAKTHRSHPTYYRGLLFCNTTSQSPTKGAVLHTLFSELDMSQIKIAFIVSGTIKNFKDIQQHLGLHHIISKGYIYQRTYPHPKSIFPSEKDIEYLYSIAKVSEIATIL